MLEGATVDVQRVQEELLDVSALVQYAISTAAEHVAEVANPNPTRLARGS